MIDGIRYDHIINRFQRPVDRIIESVSHLVNRLIQRDIIRPTEKNTRTRRQMLVRPLLHDLAGVGLNKLSHKLH